MTFFVTTLALNFKPPVPSVSFNLLNTDDSDAYDQVKWGEYRCFEKKENTSNAVDFIAVIWVVAAIPEKCEDLAISWYQFYLPKGHLWVDSKILSKL